MSGCTNMAARTRILCGMCPLFLVCFGIFFSSAQCSEVRELPTSDQLGHWAKVMGESMLSLNGLAAAFGNSYNLTHKTHKGVTINYEDIDGSALVNEMAKTLSTMLLKKMDALNKSVTAAEAAVRNHDWKQDLKQDDVEFSNTKTMMGIPMVMSDRFGKEVNFNISSVHIPVEIFVGNIDILNGLKWTSGLDAQFKENYENDPDILWQYFGSQSGFMRTYPATQWNIDGVDLYDVRRQSWYTQGSSSPKDMMILIDTSGSTYGQSLQLMKNAVKSILNTLGENDFVNVVEFSSEAKFVGKCFNHTAFVQANFRNKKQLEKDVDRLSAMGQADFSVAIRFAFEKFAEFSRNETDDENNMGANCNKVIMLLTDGGTDNAEEVFKEHNWPNKSVRVFTYAVGPTPNPIHAVRWMACANRGYFSQIPAMGAIRARVQDYVLVLARPLALSHVEHTLWTSSHQDIFHEPEDPLGYTSYLKESKELTGAQDMYWEVTFDPREYIPVLSRPQVIKNKKTYEWGNIYEDHLGLGMMTTVTLPVYNNTLGSSNQTILGVMGVDVTTAQLESQTPFEKIGPSGYSFAINPNGYVVFHPNLKTQGKFMKEPPNIDILELEVEDKFSTERKLVDLRTEMIKGGNGQKDISSLNLSPDRRYVSKRDADYFYVPVENTTFRLGISLPHFQKKYRHLTADFKNLKWPDADIEIIEGRKLEIFVAPWKFHKNRTKQNELPQTLKELIKQVNSDSNPDNWNLQRLYNLYLDAHIVNDSINFMKNNLNFSSSNESVDTDVGSKVEAGFLMTTGGVILVFAGSEAAFFEPTRDLRKSSLFLRTLNARACILVADHTEGPRSNASEPPYIDISCGHALQDKKEVTHDKPVVYGVRVTHERLMTLVDDSAKNLPWSCKGSDLLCYLVDDGGFVVATSRDDYRIQVGRFLGQVDPPLMSSLNGTVYHRVVQYDFQAACKKTKSTMSAGFRSFTIPSLSMMTEFLNIGFWTNQISWMFSSFSLYSWLMTPTVEVLASAPDEEDKECVKVFSQYYLNLEDNNGFNATIQCENCTRMYRGAKVDNFDLVLIVSDPICEECSEIHPAVSQASREISPEDEEAIICELARNPRNRVQAYGCYHEDSREDQTECGCGNLKLSRWSVIIAVICIAWMWLPQAR